ncbi:MAG TPA: glycosyltransferase family 1 protein [Anaerolineae bacterium]|nr:glycosyltransferase family 1 protein [Anaerolineae bacterium]HOQ99479.1 glycosyltransferase family 1 protein [Anaerolineae bacterium]HPL28242.1 glycosyltransferase family 1 protein [Anaerolineae bacterium]
MLIGIDASRAVVARRTGTENYALQVIRGLAQVGAAHRFRLYLREPAPAGLLPHGPRVEHIILGPRRLWTHLGLSLEMLRRPPDVLFVPAHVVPLWHPTRSVVTLHDIGYRFFPRQHTWRSRLYLDASTRFSCRAARRIIADSLATARDLEREYGVPRERVTIVYPGLDPAIVRAGEAAQQAVRERYHLPGSFVLYVGTIQPRKNLVRLVEAFGRLPASLASVDLVIAGQTGWLAGDIFGAVRRQDLEGRVHFPGYIAQEDLPALLSAAECFVMPSLYEGFGLPVLEAMACGTPVICSDGGSLPEVAGDAALLFPAGDVAALAQRLARLLDDAALQRDLAARGLAWCRRFSWQSTAQGILDVLTEGTDGTGGTEGM